MRPPLVNHQFIRAGESPATDIADVGALKGVLGSPMIQKLLEGDEPTTTVLTLELSDIWKNTNM